MADDKFYARESAGIKGKFGLTPRDYCDLLSGHGAVSELFFKGVKK